MRLSCVRLSLFVTLGALATTVSCSRRPAKREYSTHDYYLLEHDPSSGVPVSHCADALGAELVEQVGELEDHWLVRIQKPDGGEDRDVVLDAFANLRSPSSELHPQKRHIATAIRSLERQVPRQRTKRLVVPLPEEREPAPPPVTDDTLARDIAERLGIVDPLFPDQWHLVNEDYPEHMVNATPVWEMGITGEGIISALVDDGLEFESEDIADNFDAAGSHDFNDHVDLPRPMLFDDHHGTRCAGQIAAVKNGVCGVGIAYGSKVAGIRILSGPITDVDEGAALNFGYQNTSIYSCSWGPADDGRSMEAPSYIVRKAIVNGVQNGRDGKGSVFVFASGNGAWNDDQCNFDGYTNSIYSVTVAAVDFEGKHPYYSEACAANMVVTYSSGSNPKKSIVTTDIGKNKCSSSHGGTSAAAPNAAGIFALALSVRPDLTWRDIQHLCVQSAEIINPDEDWELTAAGKPYSYTYGFGKLDAYAFVTAAQKWTLVKPQAWVELPAVQIANGEMDENRTMTGGELISSEGIESSIRVDKSVLNDNNFETLEHVTVRVWITHSRRGDVEVELTSPSGVTSMLARKRKRDDDADGFPGWKFMSVKHWGENPEGEWTIRVSDQDIEEEEGFFLGWEMSLWGSVIDPAKARPYVLKDTDYKPFPPPEPVHEQEPETTAASTTKSYLKPTVVHSSTTAADGTESTTTVGVVPGGDSHEELDDEGAVTHESDLSDPRFVVAIIGFVSFFILAGGAVYLIMRRKIMDKNHSGEYSTVPGSDEEAGALPMTSMEGAGGASRSNVIYDENEESSRLMDAERRREGVSSNPHGFHSGFLDDDEEPLEKATQYSDAQERVS
ncbi:hypothetical protein SCHPADRAFT_1001607 [Schizopora paradoxa]|uniref:P/Homo B domain-containing protein n=1 Tax=Schizopora paradoxa TaxID=27342 RepID=A0A0H2RDC2_9AGAM|nr:hypothetical protein SCHPADRAFT_1001607 [Schizopora paradoxa]